MFSLIEQTAKRSTQESMRQRSPRPWAWAACACCCVEVYLAVDQMSRQVQCRPAFSLFFPTA